jgi:hypothetical protein
MSNNATQVIGEKINNTFIDEEEFIVTDNDNNNKHKLSIDTQTDKEENIIDLDKVYEQSNNINNKKTKDKKDKIENKIKKDTKTINSTYIDIDLDINGTEDNEEPTASNDNDNDNDIDDSDTNNSNIKQAIKKIGSRTFRTQIMKQYIRPRMEKDINDSIAWRDKWGKIANVFFSFAEILCIIQTVLAFTASSYDLKLISYLAGMLGVLSISFNRFGTYSRNASSEKTSQLNEILGTIGIKDMVPDLMDNDYGDGDKRASKIK